MRLAKISLLGYRKLVNTECKFASKLTAVVGPNEAGKSTLLDALVSLQNDDEIPASAHPFGLSVSPQTEAMEVWYRITEEDNQACGNLDTDDNPEFYVVTKTYDGSRAHRIEPEIQRRIAPTRTAVSAVQRYAATVAAKALERNDEEDGAGDALDRVNSILEEHSLNSTLTDEQSQSVDALIAELGDDRTAPRGRQALTALQTWKTQMQQQSPDHIALAKFDEMEPTVALFGEAERNLRSSYNLVEVADNPPVALRNMADLADLDLPALRDAYLADNPGAVTTATENACEILQQRLNAAWKQSNIVVRMPLDGGTVRLLVKTDARHFDRVAEHSDGLKTFLALTAFAHSLQKLDVPLVLLIDEAEQHLHYDAQADLVRMLERQSLAPQVIYSTHSAGCLPSDLGTGVRAVTPIPGEGRSKVTNSLWQAGPGFTPLLMALGAGAAAFAPSRYAVFGEGATEMLLLPSLIREATGEDRLEYQVTAGLAEVANGDLRQLELEAPRVVYAVDGDPGGRAHSTRLSRSGVKPDRIVHLGGFESGLTIEALIREDLYLEALNEVLIQLGSQSQISKAAFNANWTRDASIKAWCATAGVKPPGKPAVAMALLELRENRPLLTREGVRVLKQMHKDIMLAMDISSG